MPKINRIRIANIQYDKKVIKDLFIDCYRGENVLLNLANGGGKSVLVQLLQQPILPESKIHGREIQSYLSPDQASYILIEWKLDNSPKNYLLTGIVMSKLFSSDDMNKTKYFTFLNEYQSSNEFDIKNIPFIQKEENAIIYKSYETAMQMIRENRTLENLRIFGRSEQAEYRSKLSEYGVFINEWKTLAKINENEGGVDEIFRDCKTSDNLVNKWILKAISDSNEAESRELKEMFISLMQEIVEKESNIKEKEILEEFKEKVKEYQEPLTKLLEQLDKEKQVKETIYEIYLSFQNLSKENQDKIEQITQRIMQNEEELKKIEYEEVSEEYYHLQSDLEDIKEKMQEKQEQFELQKQIYEKAKFEYRLQEVAHLNEREKEANANIEALNIRKRNLLDKNNTDEQLIKIEYNLQEQYSNKIIELNNKITEIETDNANIKEKVENYKQEEGEYQNNINEISIKLGETKEKIKSFEKEEKEVFDKLKIFISRNLLNELEEREVQSIKEDFEKQIEKLNKEIEEKQSQTENAINQIKELNKKEEQNHSQIEELTKQEVQKARIYEEFQEKKEEVKHILEFHRIQENEIFQKTIYMSMIEEKHLEYKRKVEEAVSCIDKVKEYLQDLEQGGIHNSREIRELLDNANIGYISGEEFLKKQQEEYRKELLENNPLLPYCYIVAQHDLEKIKTMDIEENSNKLAPIVTHSSLSKKVAKDGGIVQIDEIYFLSLYNKECFSTNTKQYKEKLESQLESYKRRKKEEEIELGKIEEHIRILNSFNYKEKNEKEMQEEIANLQKRIEDLREQNRNYKGQIEKLDKENQIRSKESTENQERLREIEQKQEKYLLYLDKNTKYCEEKKQKENFEINIRKQREEIRNINIQLDEIKDREKKNTFEKKDLENKLKEIEKKKLKIPKIEKEQEKLENSLEEIEAQYEELTKEYEQDIKQVDEQIEIWNKNKQDAKKDKQRKYSDIKEEDYINIIYSEDLEDLNKEKSEEEEKRLKEREEELLKVNTEYTRIDTRFKTSIDKLRNMGKQEAISASQIKGNYEERKKKIEQEKLEGLERQKEYANRNRKLQTDINTIERNIDIKDIENLEEKHSKNILEKSQEKELNLHEIINDYKKLEHENQAYKNNIYKMHVDISSSYKDKHRIISSFLDNVSIKEAEEKDYGTYYYIYEKLIECSGKLIDYINILNLSLQNIEQDKKNILEHAVKQGTMLYQEMKKISESSKIKIGERYVQILKIEIPQEIKEYVQKRIENHIEECIQVLREECKQSVDIKRTIEDKVVIYLSDRKLLNLVLDAETIKVKLYKFDIENKNSGLRYWEDVIVENSGGQKFIACFALFSALVEYTRRKELESLGEEEKVEASKVFILDNPFGKTSSKHLLEPMIEISKKFNIQMICLSDLSQSSITDKFTLIYQLALRSSKYTSNSFLMVEDARSNGEVTKEASLEQVYLRSQTEQISFWN